MTEFKLPKQVEEQSALADEFMATFLSKEEEDTAETEELDEEAEAEEEEAGTAEEEEEALETAGEEEQEEEEEPDDDEEETYKQRYNSLQGKYNAEVPKLNKELRKLKDEIFERLGNVAAKKEQPSEEDDTASFEAELEAYREQFGDDLIEAIDKLTERKAKALLGESLSPVSAKVDSVESAQIESAQIAFTQDLSSKVEGDWQALWSGEDQGFVEFLDSVEPNGMFTYREVAEKANNNWDADKLSKVFNAYLKTQEEEPAPVKKDPVKEKTNNDPVAPKRSKVASEPDAAEPKIWTTADIKAFQEKDRRGKIPAEESEALWSDLMRAPAENRVIN